MTPGTPTGLAFGVDVGGTKVLGVALAGEDQVVAEVRVPTPQAATDPAAAQGGAGAVEVATAIAEVLRALAGASAVTAASAAVAPAPAPALLGVGIPGMLDGGGVLRFSPNLPGAVGAAVPELVAGCLGAVWLRGRRVHVDNDANCAALGELRLGAARGAGHAVVVTLGTGIGGGLVVQGEVLRGAHGFAGEVGHMVVEPSGPPCPCGGRGCWERLASGGGLARLAREAAFAGTLHEAVALAGGDPELVRGEHVTRAALEGDAGAMAVLEQLGWWVALGLSNLAALVDPERFVIGGGLAEVGEVLFEPTRRAFAALVEGGPARPPVPILPAALGERAGAIGAALMARERDASAPSP